MKTTLKRTLALVLTVCMLLSVLPFAASAADTIAYSGSGIETALTNESIKKEYVALNHHSNNSTYSNEQFRMILDNDKSHTSEGSFYGMQFNNITAGNYTVTITVGTANARNRGTIDIYAFPISAFDGVQASLRKNVVQNAIANHQYRVAENFEITTKGQECTFTADLSDTPVLVFVYIASPAGETNNRQFFFSGFSFTPNASAATNIAEINGTGTTSIDEVKTALSQSGNNVTLLADVDLGAATLASQTTLNLNGKTVSGDLAIWGTVTGAGKFVSKPAINTSAVALATDGGYIVTSCDIKVDNTPVVNNNGSVSFWFQVTLGNADAYALAKADNDFKIGINVTAGGSSTTCQFVDDFANAWADAMTGEDAENVSICVTINNAADIAIDLTPNAGGVAGTTAISYVPAV